MTLLHEVLAAEKGIKSRVTRDLTDLHRSSAHAPSYAGMTRTYRPRNEDGDPLPPEVQRVQLHSHDVLGRMSELLSDLFDVTASKDYTNMRATADVVVDGQTLLTKVPVTTLLFLEKQLNDLDTVIRKMPTLDPAVSWTWSNEQMCYLSDEVLVNRTQKTSKPVQLAPATDKHPAQVQMVTEDIVVGQYHTIKQSGALSVKDHNALLSRIATLKLEVKAARQRANGAVAENPKIASTIFDYLLARK